MKRLTLVGVLASCLLLLTGCTDSAVEACKMVVKTKIEYQDISKDYLSQYLSLSETFYDDGEYTLKEDELHRNLYRKHIQARKDANTVIVNNPGCFSPKRVVEAEKIIDGAKIYLDNA